MSNNKYQIENKNNIPQYHFLHQNQTKFWEMEYQEDDNTTIIRCGKILEFEPDLIQDPDDQISKKTHADENEAIKYIEKHVNTKLGRGYEFKKTNKRKGSDLSASDNEGSNTKKLIKGNDKQGIPSISVSAPTDNNNNNNSNNKKGQSNKNLLSDNNRAYSQTSKKPSLSELTDLSQARSGSPSTKSQNIDTSGLGLPSKGPEAILLAKKWEKDVDPSGWYMSEKMDGLRGFWTGTHIYSRNKNRFWAPEFFTKNWPKCQMDGELFTKRDDFAKAVSIVKRQKSSVPEDWEQIRYVVYDIPGLNKPFKQRQKAMEEILAQIDNPYIIVHPQVLCTGFDHVEEELAKVLAKGGEGLMLRDPKSMYERTRSNSLLKVKVMHDEEATVIGYSAGTRGSQLIGAMVCRNDAGVEFKVGQGLTDQQRMRPPKKGTVITYKYQNKQPSGKPRFPIFVRVKTDAGV